MEKAKKPFFSKFLEAQKVEDSKIVKGGRTLQTDKFPSDNDEAVTLKYPSDNDEYITLKYPSDDDEYMTLKYPSDDDEGILV
ncbi:MAG: microviridin/marinostatin family tricyclic proteinase inhibitor [Bacteroidota bacterium]